MEDSIGSLYLRKIDWKNCMLSDNVGQPWNIYINHTTRKLKLKQKTHVLVFLGLMKTLHSIDHALLFFCLLKRVLEEERFP